MDKKTYTKKQVDALVRDYARHLRDEHNTPIEHVFVFGSYAKHRARPWSDIDVCIVSPIFKHEDRLTYLWTRRRDKDVDAMIAPVGFTPEDFRNTTTSPLVHEVRTTGEAVSL